LARTAIRNHLTGEMTLASAELRAAFPDPAGAFVTLRRKTGELRGCVGSQHACAATVLDEVLRVAPLAATRDPRFPPVGLAELDGLSIEVSILTPLEPVTDVSKLDAHRYGISICDAEGRTGLLLPNIPGIDTVARQLKEVRIKAGIGPDAPITIHRFEVSKFR
jgi:AmmeMemoRadiSam system protein A